MEWSSQDPRWEIAPRAVIVVFCPHTQESFTGTVETKHGYNVLFYGRAKDERQLVMETEEWPDNLVWIKAPCPPR